MNFSDSIDEDNLSDSDQPHTLNSTYHLNTGESEAEDCKFKDSLDYKVRKSNKKKTGIRHLSLSRLCD